jgi:hypothetical protein
VRLVDVVKLGFVELVMVLVDLTYVSAWAAGGVRRAIAGHEGDGQHESRGEGCVHGRLRR